MSTRGLLEQLADEGLVDRAALDAATPLGKRARDALAGLTGEGLRLQQAGASVSVWLGALLLAIFLVEMEITEVVPLGLALGATGLGLAAALARGSASLLELQLRWIATIGGQILILVSLSEVVGDDEALCVATILLQAVTVWLVRDLAIGVASILVGAGALLVLAAELHVGAFGHGLLALFLGTCICGLWVLQAPLSARLGRLWQPLAYALPLAVWGPITIGAGGRHGSRASDALPMLFGSWAVEAMALSAGWAALSTWLMVQAGRERPELRGRALAAALVGIWLTALLGLDTPGLSAGLTLLLLGQLRGSHSLRLFGLTAIGGFLFFWYYEHGSTLLSKSIVAVSQGVLFLLLAGLLRRRAVRPREVQARPLAARMADLRWLSLALGLGLAIPGWVVTQKEQVLSAGETVLLRLRPVDPRSLMQGDYMELRYELAALPNIEAMAPRGALIVTRDADDVAQFVRVDDGRALAPGELRLRYHKRGEAVSFGAETFLFPEGEGQELEAARYGELAVAEAGDSVLIGLRDEARRPLGTRLHDR
ncbi:GDYXXLXY domain-containing protein [Nannocystis punicea]|uniref:GDYXXLXY domain-containing protein n=1 Tax=Nannocystis punicea TaxID=2995304 RepID=A0ABY7HHS5_9BACT|nr:GDYXXLXY domain-containing protein [Nannocystis poenicansa]WAS98776.1 GDYXXLXY domain-containing protein [Nannocystis poenicansa]